MKKIAIFGSGSGSNAENICSFFSASPDIRVVLILSNNKNAYILTRAKKKNLPTIVFSKNELDDFTFLHKSLLAKKIDFIILAGFLLKIPKKMVEFYPNKIINIHPSLLPKYGGKGMYGENVHRAVLKNNEKESGITIHIVNENYDDGEILMQKKCSVSINETIKSLSKKISSLERRYFPLAIKKHLL